MKCLEIFAGNKSFSKEAEKAGWHCTTVDNDPKFEPSILVDIMEWDYSDFGPIDVFWAGTPCTLFSNASFKRDPTKGNILAQKTLDILKHFQTLNPKLIWFIENPWSSLLKRQEGFRDLPFTKVDYCQYATVPDFGYKKRTILWNNLKFQGKLCPGPGKCVNMVGKYHLCTAQQGRQLKSRAPLQQETWTRSELYRMPPALCEEIVQAIQGELGA
jgi:hypothetical protein